MCRSRRRPGDRRPRLWRHAGKVAAIAGAVAAGLADGGVLPVLKHIPGHGRANADSHLKLPVVHADRATLEATDFAAFRPLKRLPLGMTAHVVFTAIDPVRPATTSATMIGEVIRGFIGFDGLLMGDDISMGALSGSIASGRGPRSRPAAIWCCIATARWTRCGRSPPRRRSLAGDAKRRADAALAVRKSPSGIDLAAARREFAAMMTERMA
jgi:beta-N-acetylhexosaminidase